MIVINDQGPYIKSIEKTQKKSNHKIDFHYNK